MTKEGSLVGDVSSLDELEDINEEAQAEDPKDVMVLDEDGDILDEVDSNETFILHCESNNRVFFSERNEIPEIIRLMGDQDNFVAETLHIFKRGPEVVLKGYKVELEEI